MLEDNNQEARTWGMLCHLSGLLGLLLIFVGIPFAGILAPLIIWNWKKEHHPFIDAQGKESLNFQISLALYSVVIIILAIFLFFVTCGVVIGSDSRNADKIFSWMFLIFSSFLVLILVITSVFIIFAAIKAYKGEFYHYPLTVRFLR